MHLKKVTFPYLAIALLCGWFYLSNSKPVTPQFDPLMGLQMVNNDLKNISFNCFRHPDPENLSANVDEYITWWTPGQYTVPMVVSKIFNIPIGLSLKLCTIILLILYGLSIILILHFSMPTLNYIGVIVIVFGMFFSMPILSHIHYYKGGELYLIVWGMLNVVYLLALKRISWHFYLLMIGSGLVGFFFKASCLPIYGGIILYAFLKEHVLSENGTMRLPKMKALIWPFFSVLICITCIYVFFLSKGTCIASASQPYRLQLRVIVYPMIAPFLSYFSFYTLNYTWQWLLFCFLLLGLLVYIILYVKPKLTPLLLIYLCLFSASLMFYILVYLKNLDVSYEPRHFVILYLLSIPTLYSIFNYNMIAKVVIVCIFLVQFTSIAEVCAEFNKPKHISKNTYLATETSDEMIHKIRELDMADTTGNSIFYFKNNDMPVALEVKKNRILLEDNFMNFGANNEMRKREKLYFGQNCSPIYIIYPEANLKSDSAIYLSKFEYYNFFPTVYRHGGYVLKVALRINAPHANSIANFIPITTP